LPLKSTLKSPFLVKNSPEILSSAARFEAKILEIKNSSNGEFTIRDILKNHIRKLSKFSINVTFKDKEKLTPNLKQIRGLKDMFYLPFGSSYFYSADYGLKKDMNLDITDEVFD